jgi:hypothetical protein
MAVHLGRTCPRCRDYFAVVIEEEPKDRRKSRPVKGHCAFLRIQNSLDSVSRLWQSVVEKIPPVPKLDALRAAKDFRLEENFCLAYLNRVKHGRVQRLLHFWKGVESLPRLRVLVLARRYFYNDAAGSILIARLGGAVFESEQAAEDHGLELCREWINQKRANEITGLVSCAVGSYT